MNAAAAPTAASLAAEGRARLRDAGIETADLDAEILLAHLLGQSRAWLHTHPEEPLRHENLGRYVELVARRAARAPLQHLTGTQEFWSLPFHVSPAVLIPRPESEVLIETVLRLAGRPDPLIVDVCTGSGCLAVALAHALPGALVHATDSSEEALAVARRNAASNDVSGRIAFYHGDLMAPLAGRGLEGRVDVLVSNPPYIRDGDFEGLPPEVRDHEPRAALLAGADGLAVHRRLARAAPPFLRAQGILVVEMGKGQDPDLRALYGSSPDIAVTEVAPDLAGIPRVLAARRLA